MPSSGSGTALRRSAEAVGLRWTGPAAPLGAGLPVEKRRVNEDDAIKATAALVSLTPSVLH